MDDSLERIPETIQNVIDKRKRRESLSVNERQQLHRLIKQHPELKDVMAKKKKSQKAKRDIPPLPLATEGLIGYFAGLLDGEGSVFISKVKGKSRKHYEYRAVVSIANTIRGPLDSLVNYYGGSVFPLRKENKGPQGKVGRTLFAWVVSCQKAKIFINAVAPYLIIKRQRALAVASFQSRIINTGKALSEDEIKARDNLWKKIMSRENTCHEKVEQID